MTSPKELFMHQSAEEVGASDGQTVSNQDLSELRNEDRSFYWRLEPVNHTESRTPHHRSRASWAGELQNTYGQHRRGPTVDSKRGR